jgi:predicted ATP-binding protein involved in virulence
MARIVRVEVHSMLGRFDHVIVFPKEWEFVIIHGPNGVGKTKFLELITATCKFQPRRLVNIPFASAQFEFDDGTHLRITRSLGEKLDGRASRRTPKTPKSPGYVAHFELTRPKARPVVWTSEGVSAYSRNQLREFLVSRLPLHPIDLDRYEDMANDDVLTTDQVLERYSNLIPPDIYPGGEEPKQLRDFLSRVRIHLIETQRLLDLTESPPNARYGRARQDSESPKSRVSQYSEDLTRRLKEALAENSTKSQELDRTFPGRLLQDESWKRVQDERIREKYYEQTQFRKRLAEIDVSGTSSEYLPLPDRKLQTWERRVLWAYLQDTESKLDTFKNLLDRVQLLQEIVRSHFRYKSLKISQERGFVVMTDETQQEIPPDRLSSGEQHELVLLYDLLFKVQEDTLVLIDEPEISLHIGWQRKFLSDLSQISQLTSLRFIIATHSPQIIHKWWDRTISLVPPEEMDN